MRWLNLVAIFCWRRLCEEEIVLIEDYRRWSLRPWKCLHRSWLLESRRLNCFSHHRCIVVALDRLVCWLDKHSIALVWEECNAAFLWLVNSVDFRTLIAWSTTRGVTWYLWASQVRFCSSFAFVLCRISQLLFRLSFAKNAWASRLAAMLCLPCSHVLSTAFLACYDDFRDCINWPFYDRWLLVNRRLNLCTWWWCGSIEHRWDITFIQRSFLLDNGIYGC